jgi:hypothetical protein
MHATHQSRTVEVAQGTSLSEAVSEQWGKTGIGAHGDALLEAFQVRDRFDTQTPKNAKKLRDADRFSKVLNFGELEPWVQGLLIRIYDPATGRFGRPRQRQKIADSRDEPN